MGCFWISIFFILILMLGWDVLALYGIAAILSSIYYLCRSKNVGKWEMTIVIIISIFVSTGCLIGFSDYKQYRERKAQEEWLKSRSNDWYDVDSRPGIRLCIGTNLYDASNLGSQAKSIEY